MEFLHSDWIVTCDDDFNIIQDGAIVFDEKIIDIDDFETLKTKYPNQTFKYLGANSVIMPGLINSHIHLEFSANKTTLKYGNFIQWLFSVIQNREELIHKATPELITDVLNNMIQTGTTTIGAISSYGFDMQPCIDSPLNVVYFTEALGSQASMIDTLFLDFKEKLKTAQANKNDRFLPAVAIHSPYSTHPFLIREVLNIAKQEHLSVSAHFQESKEENDWLNYSKGGFVPFFKDMLKQDKSLQSPLEFLDHFKGIETLSFTHCVQANKKELEKIKELKATVIHCPNSNKLLTNSVLNLKYLKSIPYAIGTDGLSSNYTLNMFDEIRNSFFIHNNIEQVQLAQQLLKGATSHGAKALGINSGQLQKGKDSDIITFNLPDSIEDPDTLPTAIILHTTKTKHTYIKGNNEVL